MNAAVQTSAPVKNGKTLRQRLMERFSALDTEYATWKPRHQEIIDYIQPDRGAFVGRDQPNRGTRKDTLIYDATATDAEKKLSAAIEVGVFSAAREWCRLTTTIGEDVAEAYLYDAQKKFFAIMAKSNLYKCLGALVRDMVACGTGVIWIEADPRAIVRGIHFPVGSYRLATNASGRVDTIYRRFSMTTSQLVRQFGYEKCSAKVQQEWDEEKYDTWHEVQHSCEPRAVRQVGKIDAKNKPWASCWLEVAAPADAPLLLGSGFDRQPFVVGRWDYVGQNAYGTDSPAMQAIPDVRQLQDFTVAGAKMIALIIKPPMSTPSELLDGSIVPGAKNKIPGNGNARFEPSMTVPPQAVTVNAAEKAELRRSIRQAFLNELLFVINGDVEQQQVQKTAEEIRARKDEGLLQISSAYKILSDEVLDPMVNLVLALAQHAGAIPPPPPELHEVDQLGRAKAVVHVEYINNLAAAQKLLGISAVERLINATIGMFAGTQDQGVLDNVDFDEGVRVLADALGVKPSLVRRADVVKAMRDARQQAQQAKAQGDAMVQGAGAVKDLGDTNAEGLDQLAQRFGPYAQTQVRF